MSGVGTGDGGVHQPIVVKLGDNVFQSGSFDDRLLAAFKLWLVAATPGDAATKAAVEKIAQSTMTVESVAAAQAEAAERLKGTAT